MHNEFAHGIMTDNTRKTPKSVGAEEREDTQRRWVASLEKG
jgi:hypothetical protein